MFPFLRRAISPRRHIFNAISPPSTFQLQPVLQNPSPSVRFANSIASNGNSFTLSYLIDTCGFSPQVAKEVSKRVKLETRDNPDLVIQFLKSHGLSQRLTLRLLKHIPGYLRSNPEKIFLPKIEFFKSIGVLSSDIPRLICHSPNILRRSLSKHLIPSYNFLRDLFQSDEKLIQSLRYSSDILLDPKTTLVPKLEVLRAAGVPESNVIKYLQFFSRTLVFSVGKFNEAVGEVTELGFDPLTFQFLVAVHVCLSVTKSSRAKKADVYKKWGWSDNDILAAFRTFPFCLTLSEDQIDAKLEILVNQLGCNPSCIVKYATVVSYSLNKRIVPRAAVLQVLLSRGLMKSETLLAKFRLNESAFRRWLVLRQEQEVANELLALYDTKLDQAM